MHISKIQGFQAVKKAQTRFDLLFNAIPSTFQQAFNAVLRPINGQALKV
jgi:hypothetical protein